MSDIGAGVDEMASIVGELTSYSARYAELSKRPACLLPLPSRTAIADIVHGLRAVLYPGYFGSTEASGDNLPFHIGATLDLTAQELEEQIRRALCFDCKEASEMPGCRLRAAELARQVIRSLPKIQQLLMQDVVAAYEGDPACKTPDEAILSYPGVYALTLFRIAHALSDLGIPLLPRIITEIAHSETGVDIHPGAQIGNKFFIDHGTGVVIGETSIIGDRVRLYQGVTLGARSFALDEHGRPVKGVPRHPIIEDDVIIYAGATILGRITVGKGSVIGGNVWLTRSVPPGSRINQANAQ